MSLAEEERIGFCECGSGSTREVMTGPAPRSPALLGPSMKAFCQEPCLAVVRWPFYSTDSWIWLTPQNRLSMSLFMFPGIFLREQSHPEAITFLLDFSPRSACSLMLPQGGPHSPLETPQRRARLLSAKARPGHTHACVCPPSRLSVLSKVEKGPKVSTSCPGEISTSLWELFMGRAEKVL